MIELTQDQAQAVESNGKELPLVFDDPRCWRLPECGGEV